MAVHSDQSAQALRPGCRILTYNIHHANPPSVKGKIDLDAIAKVIVDAKADIVALQEVDRNTNRSGNIDEAMILGEKTGLHYRFFKAIDYDGGEYGIAILSRFPLKEVQTVPLPQSIKAEERILALATVNIQNTDIVFANTHLDATGKEDNRIVQMQAILQKLEGEKRPVILCGDLNCEATSTPVRLLDSLFKRACMTGCAPTFPQDKPVRTIDYIASRNLPWDFRSYQVIPETYASDHRPVVVISD